MRTRPCVHLPHEILHFAQNDRWGARRAEEEATASLSHCEEHSIQERLCSLDRPNASLRFPRDERPDPNRQAEDHRPWFGHPEERSGEGSRPWAAQGNLIFKEGEHDGNATPTS